MKISPRRSPPPPPPPLPPPLITTITSTTTTFLALLVVVVAVTANGGLGEDIHAHPTITTTTSLNTTAASTLTSTSTTNHTNARNTPPLPPPHPHAPTTTITSTGEKENEVETTHLGGSGGIRQPTIATSITIAATTSTAAPRALSCPEDLCKITQVTDNAGEVLSAAPPLKVACHDHLRITSLTDIWPHCLSNATRLLDLSESGLTRLSPLVLSHLPNLEKLDLKNNQISIIESGAFANLSSLRRLDLSDNDLKSLNASQLAGLVKLKKLKLARNPLARLQEGILDELPNLKGLDLAQTRLVCDCGLTWLAEAVQRRDVRVHSASKCFSPRALNNTQIKKLKPDQLLCHGPGLSVVELEPGLDQVVFAGDSLRLRCRVTSAQEGHRVWWAKGNTHLLPRKPSPHNHTSATVTGYLDQHQQRGGAVVRNTYLPEAIESLVEIEELNGTHSGDWSCLVQGQQGNHTRTVSIYVIAHDTKYCPMNATSDNRGSYVWPRTVAGVRVELACAGLVPPHQRGSHKFTSKTATTTSTSSTSIRNQQHHTLQNAASPQRSLRRRVAEHICSEEGHWEALNTGSCPFVSETTKILEQFAQTNVFASKTSLVDSTRSLRNFTREGKNLQDPMDVVFLAKTVEQYTGLLTTLPGPKETADTLIDIISASMSASKELLAKAEALDRSCARLVGCLWEVASHFPSLPHATAPHLEMHQFSRHPNTFSGLTCTWYRRSAHSTERHFRCNTNNYSKLYSSDDEILDAQIQVPSSLFSHGQPLPQTSTSTAPPNSTEDDLTPSPAPQSPVHLQFFVYKTAKLFPRVAQQGDGSDSWEVTSPVIGARVSRGMGPDGVEGGAWEDGGAVHVEDSVYVTLRSAIYSYSIVPVWWRANASSGGRGEWTSDGCKIVKMHNSLVVFRCDRLAHFGLLQDMAARHRGRGGAEEGAAFRPSAPGVYVGSAICAAFLMASIVTWAAHHSRIATAGKNKHSLLNTWVALLLLVALFTAGAHQTHHRPLCQGIGVALHYLTTCVLLWTTVTVTNLYKKVAKALRPPVPPEEAPPDVPLPPKPMLRFYLVGWGIALILCGISAAVNLHQYAGYHFCFLAWGPSLGAFVAPTAALTLILATFFLLTHCSLRSLRAAYPATAAATAETTELELLDAASPSSEAAGGATAAEEVSLASRDTSTSVTDGQHSPLTQLRAHAVTLLLFGLTWTAAAITTAAPFQEVIPHHTAVFSAIYAICASSLGIFIFVFFCLSRGDVWEAWRGCRWGGLLPRRGRKEEEEVRLTSAPANNTTMAANNQTSGRPGEARCPRDAPSTHSLESSQTHNTNKSSSVSQSILTSTKGEGVVVAKAANNLQLLSLGAMTNDLHYTPEIFYNPKQAGVAKRFFQKQRLRQMVKQNNLEVNRADSDCNSTVYRPKLSRPLNTEANAHSGFDPACLGASSKVNNTNIHVDGVFPYLGGEMRPGGSKQASKDPTPEVLCVLGPAPELYPTGRGSEGERGWSTIPRKPRAFMEEPLSPLRRGGSFPSITEEGRPASRAPSQTSTLDQPPYAPPEAPPQQHPRLYSFPPPGAGPHYHHHLQGAEDEPPSRKARGAFTPEQGEHSSDHSRHGRSHRYRAGRERPRPGRNKRRPVRVRGGVGSGVGAGEGREDWTDDNTPPVIINLSPGDAGRSSGSDKDAVTHQFLPFPVRGRSATPPGAPRGMLDQRAHPQDPASLLCMDLTWPHVMATAMASDHSGRGRSDHATCQCLHGFPPGMEGPTGLGVCCEAEDGGAVSWDSEGGEGYWCAGGGEQRASACEVSGCDASSLCGGGLSASSSSGSSSGSCGGGGGGVSEGGSVDPAVGTSPRGSVNISDSPYDSPLHRLHQNTPDSGSLDSGLLCSPGRPPPVHGAAPGPHLVEGTTSAESLNLPRDLGTPSPTGCYLTNSSAETVLRRSDHGVDSDEGTGFGDEGRPGQGQGAGKGAGWVKGQENGQRESDGEVDGEPEANPKRETCV